MRVQLKIAACFSLSLLLAKGGAAQAPSGTSTAKEAPDEKAINVVAEKLCRAEPIIGTRIPVRHRCDTPAELSQYRAQAREIIDQYRRRPCMAGTGSGENDATMPC